MTDRLFQIINKLLDTETDIKIKELSNEWQVSDRTIKYDLENVRDWFLDHKVQLRSRPNKGIWIEEDEYRRNHLRMALNKEKSKLFHSQESRVKEIIKILLLANQEVTAQELSERLQVSRNTILNDLHHVESFLYPWQVSLLRQPRVGHSIDGREAHKRVLLEHLLHGDLTNYDIYQIMKSFITDEKNHYFEVDEGLQEGFDICTAAFRQAYRATDPAAHHFDSAYLITLLFRMTIAITRLKMGSTLGNYLLLDENQAVMPEEKMVLQTIKWAFEAISFPLFEAEYFYILGAAEHRLNQVDLANISEKIISFISEKSGISYKSDLKLYGNLLAHLSLRCQNGSIKMAEYNPLTAEIKKNHHQLFQLVQEACNVYIGENIIKVPDSFAALITLHFLVSYESKAKQEKVKALYVCVTGKGVARLIKNRVEANVYQIEVVSHCSIMEVENFCKENQVDMIISVFPLETSLPVMILNGLPSKQDIEKIQSQVDKIIEQKEVLIHPFYDLKLPSFEKPQDSSEEIALEIIIKGFELNQEIVALFGPYICQEKMEALKMHIFFMLHRYFFDQQYDNYMYSPKREEEIQGFEMARLEKLFASKEIFLYEAEVKALLQYFKLQ